MKKFLSKVGAILKSVANFFTKVLPNEIEKAVGIAITVAEGANSVVSSPVADVATVIIPGTVDDKVKLYLRATLPSLISRLKAIQALNLAKNGEEAKQAVLDAIGTLDDNTDLQKLIEKITEDGKLNGYDANYILEWYSKYKPAA